MKIADCLSPASLKTVLSLQDSRQNESGDSPSWLNQEGITSLCHKSLLTVGASSQKPPSVLSDAVNTLEEMEACRGLVSHRTWSDLLNAIAAHQCLTRRVHYRNYRRGQVAEAQDAVQARLFERVKQAARGELLPALGGNVTDDMLEEIGLSLLFLRERMQEEVTQYRRAVASPCAIRPTKRRQKAVTHAVTSTPSVLEARTRIQNKHLVLIGGIRKVVAIERMKRVFDCQVTWIALDKSPDPQKLEQILSKSDLIFTLIGLCGHYATKIANRMHRTHGIPLVRISGGYGVSSIAHGLLTQVFRV